MPTSSAVRAGDDRRGRPRGDGTRHDRSASRRWRTDGAVHWRSALPRPRLSGRECQFRAQAHPGRFLRGAWLSRQPASDWSEAVATGRQSGTCPYSSPTGRGPWPDVFVSVGWSSCSFASRTIVGQARAQGASACLELPYDLLDLGHVLARVIAPWANQHTQSHRDRVLAGRAAAAARKNLDPRPAAGGRPRPGCRMTMNGHRRTVDRPRSRRA